MIKNIVFDIGQVLASFKWQQFILDMTGQNKELSERIGRATVAGPFWDELDRGILSQNEIVELCVQHDKGIEKEIRQFFNTRKEIVKEYPYAPVWIKELKAREYMVYILSNYSEQAYLHLKNISEFPGLVDGAVISYEVKVIKPEAQIYEILLDKYSLVPEETVFLDDREVNVRGAEKAGMTGIHFTDYESARAELENKLAK